MVKVASLTDLVVPVAPDTHENISSPAAVSEPLGSDEKMLEVMVIQREAIDDQMRAQRQRMAAKLLLGAAAIGCVIILLK